MKLAKGQGTKDDADSLIALTKAIHEPETALVERRLAAIETAIEDLSRRMVALGNAVGMRVIKPAPASRMDGGQIGGRLG